MQIAQLLPHCGSPLPNHRGLKKAPITFSACENRNPGRDEGLTATALQGNESWAEVVLGIWFLCTGTRTRVSQPAAQHMARGLGDETGLEDFVSDGTVLSHRTSHTGS